VSTTLWQLLHYLHLLAMAFFIGGQLVVVAAVVPVERAAPDQERMRAIGRRFGYGSLVALAVLVATGVAMAADRSLWDLGTLQIKLGLVGLVVALTTAHLLWPRQRLLQVAILTGSLAIVWLGMEIAH
jgi:putative copper export protein